MSKHSWVCCLSQRDSLIDERRGRASTFGFGSQTWAQAPALPLPASSPRLPAPLSSENSARWLRTAGVRETGAVRLSMEKGPVLWTAGTQAGCRMAAPSVPSLTLTFLPKELCTQTKQPHKAKGVKLKPSTSIKITKLCQLMQTDTNTWGGGGAGKLVVTVSSLPELTKARSTDGEGNGTPLQYSCLENPWTEEPGRLQSMGSLRVGHD